MPNGEIQEAVIKQIMEREGVDYKTALRIFQLGPEEAERRARLETIEPYEDALLEYLNRQLDAGLLTSQQVRERASVAIRQAREQGYHRGLPYFTEIQAMTEREEGWETYRTKVLALAKAEEASAKARYGKAEIEAEVSARPLPKGMEGQRFFAEAERQRAQAFRRYRPAPEYMPAFEEERLGLVGAQPWKEWFERSYPTLVRRFEAKLPEFRARYYPGLYPEEAEKKIAKTWAEYLKEEKPKLREEWWALSPYQRGERPSAYAPRIKTVGF